MTTSKSHGSGLERTDPKSISNLDLSYPDMKPKQVNGSQENFLNKERELVDEGSTETLVPHTSLQKTRDEMKANMNRIDSHHNNLEALGRPHADLHK
jgi:hypothetical protein